MNVLLKKRRTNGEKKQRVIVIEVIKVFLLEGTVEVWVDVA